MLSFGVLKLRDFRLLLFTRIFVLMALQAQAVIVGWQVYSLTKDPFMLGLTGLVEAVPALTCALFAGHVVDVNKPHRVFMFAMCALVLNTLMLFVLGGELVHIGTLLPWIFLGIFISGLARSFVMPSAYALLSQVLPRSDIPAATGWLNSGFQLSAIAGPAIAGLIYGGYGVLAAWTLPMALMTCGFLTLAAMSSHPRNYRSQEKREPAMQSIKAGWRFIFNNPVLLSVMALDMFAVLFGGAVIMLPAYAEEVLKVGSEGLGALRAAPAIGAIGMALILALWPLKRIKAIWLLWVVTGFGLCIVGFGLSTIFWLSMVFLALSGAFDSVSMIIRSTLMQWLTPDNMRGRVSSVNSMFIISSNEIGAFRSGMMASLLGLVPSVVIGGIATLVIAGLTAKFSPKLRRMEIDAESSAS